MYYLAPHPCITAAHALLAPSRARIEDAFADMREGVVFNDRGHIVAFHDRHTRLLELRGHTRMDYACHTVQTRT